MSEEINKINNAEESKQLTDEEIEKIIEEKYSEKNDYTKRFIFKAIKRHGLKFSYKKTIKTSGYKEKVIITCPIHGDFITRSDTHISCSGTGCKQCSFDNFKSNLEEFRQKAKEIFPQYEIVEGEKYVNNRTKIKMYCTIHKRTFEITPGNLLYGKVGCPDCNRENKIESRRKTDEKRFIKYFKKHFDSSECELVFNKDGSINYINQDLKTITVKCNRCGSIFRISVTEIKRKLNLGWTNVCLTCNRVTSFAEKCVGEWLARNGIEFETEVCHHCNEIQGKHEKSSVRIDFQLVYKNINYWIEPAGEQHYKFVNLYQKNYDDFLSQVKRDKNVRKYCKQHNIIYIEIPYLYNKRTKINNLLDEIILNGKSPEDIIKIPKIKFKEGGSEDGQ